MAGEITMTVVGNLTSDPELRFTPSGAAVANFTVANTPRYMKDGQWVDGDATFLRCNVWKNMAEHIAEGLKRGDRVIVVGRLRQRSFETQQGEKRTVMELEVDEVGPSSKFKVATVSRVERTRQAPPDPANDPWGSPPPPPGRSGGYPDEPPF